MNEDRSARYHRLRRRSSLAGLSAGALSLLALIAGGWSEMLRNAAVGLTSAGPSSPSTAAVYALLLAASLETANLPLACYRGFLLERRYDLSAEPFGAWLLDRMKGILLASLLAAAAACGVSASISRSPFWWWVPGAASGILILTLVARYPHVLLMPRRWRGKRLDCGPLRTRLLALAERAGVAVLDLTVLNVGDRTRRANAAVLGAGPRCRVLLTDTLLQDYTEAEIEVVVAHEIGHYVHGDIDRLLILQSAVIAAGFWAAAGVLAVAWQPLGLAGPGDAAGLPLLVLGGLPICLCAGPVLNALARNGELRADEYALALTRQPAAFVSALRRLTTRNLAEERPSRVAVWLFHTHPSFGQRIKAAEAFASVSPPGELVLEGGEVQPRP